MQVTLLLDFIFKVLPCIIVGATKSDDPVGRSGWAFLAERLGMLFFSEFDYENIAWYRREGLGDFSSLRDRWIELNDAEIALTRANFFKIDRIIAAVLEKTGSGHLEFVPHSFSLLPLNDIDKRFLVYFNEYLISPFCLGRIEFSFRIFDRELFPLLEKVARMAGYHQEKHLLIALGAVCDEVFTGPVRILIDPTNWCNLNCIYCRTFSEARATDDRFHSYFRRSLDLSTMKRHLEAAKKLGVERLSLVGGAEPTTLPSFDDLLLEIDKTGLKTDISTNGILLDRKRIARIVSCQNIESITFSISAASEAIYALVHPGKGRLWKLLLGNIANLAAAKAKGGIDYPHLVFLFVIHRHNFEEIEAAAKLAIELGFDSIWYQMLHIDDWNQDLACTSEQLSLLGERLERTKKFCHNSGLRWETFIDPQVDQIDLRNGRWSGNISDQGCFVGWYFSFYFHLNTLMLCCGMRQIAEIGGENDFLSIWHSDIYRFYRQQAKYLNRQVNILSGNGTLLNDDFCQCCDNHNYNEEVISYLQRTGLVSYVDRTLFTDLYRSPSLTLETLTGRGNYDDKTDRIIARHATALELILEYTVHHFELNTFIKIFIAIEGYPQKIVSVIYLSIEDPPGRYVRNITFDKIPFLSFLPLKINAWLVYREQSMEFYYESRRISKSLSIKDSPDHLVGLIAQNCRIGFERIATKGRLLLNTSAKSITLLGFLVREKGGQPVANIRSNKGYRFEFDYFFPEPFEKPVFQIHFYLEDQNEPIHFFGFQKCCPKTVGEGMRLYFTIVDLDFPPGGYWIHAKLTMSSGNTDRLFHKSIHRIIVEGEKRKSGLTRNGFTQSRAYTAILQIDGEERSGQEVTVDSIENPSVSR